MIWINMASVVVANLSAELRFGDYGKSTVSWQLFTELAGSGTPTAFADADQLFTGVGVTRMLEAMREAYYSMQALLKVLV